MTTPYSSGVGQLRRDLEDSGEFDRGWKRSGNDLPPNAKTFSESASASGWTGFALLPPNYPLCTDVLLAVRRPPGRGRREYRRPSLSGNATKTTVGGKKIYSDAFWNNKLIGDFSTRGLHDDDKTLVPSLHNFVYDVWFYGDNLEVSEALEFDFNQFLPGKGFIWGHECRIKGGHEWDIWDNVNEHWIKTGIPATQSAANGTIWCCGYSGPATTKSCSSRSS